MRARSEPPGTSHCHIGPPISTKVLSIDTESRSRRGYSLARDSIEDANDPKISAFLRLEKMLVLLAQVLLRRVIVLQKRTERDNMETLESVANSNIHFHDVDYQAVVCHRCGTKIYPIELLDAHLDRHQVKDLYLEGELKRLQYAMGRMR